MKGEIASYTSEIPKILRDYHEQYVILWTTCQQIGQSRRNKQVSGDIQPMSPGLSQEETENLNRSITRSEIESLI